MMIGALTTAAAGLRSSVQRFDKSAADVVKATSSGTDSSINSTQKDSGDLPAAIVGTKESALSFKANAAVFKTADKMMGALLDTIA